MLFALQGACWRNLRAGSELGERTQDAALRAWVTVVAVHGVAGIHSLWAAPHLWKPSHHPLTWIAPVVMLVSLCAVPFLVKGGLARAAFSRRPPSSPRSGGSSGRGSTPASFQRSSRSVRASPSRTRPRHRRSSRPCSSFSLRCSPSSPATASSSSCGSGVLRTEVALADPVCGIDGRWLESAWSPGAPVPRPGQSSLAGPFRRASWGAGEALPVPSALFVLGGLEDLRDIGECGLRSSGSRSPARRSGRGRSARGGRRGSPVSSSSRSRG